MLYIVGVMAQDVIFVTTKDGKAFSLPAENLDSISFNIPSSMNVVDVLSLQKENDSLRSEIAKCSGNITYEYVDLGLPSGTLWATCNIGATKPEEYGNYYAWGETETKETYTKDNYRWNGVSCESLIKKGVLYNVGDAVNKGNLNAFYDVATINWGVDWRMPTKEETTELCSLESEEVEVNGIVGRLFVGTNGNTLFLPHTGEYIERR